MGKFNLTVRLQTLKRMADDIRYSTQNSIDTLNEVFDGGNTYRSKVRESASFDRHGNWEFLNARAGADSQSGFGGTLGQAKAETSYATYRDRTGCVDIMKGSVEGGFGAGAGGVKAKVKANVDLVDTTVKVGDRQSLNASLGLNADTGFEAGCDGVNVSVAGIGFSLGRNTGIQTPFGKIGFKAW